MIIYPPFIGETIPGFTRETNSGITTYHIKIPFTMNPAVSQEEVNGFALQIKNYANPSIVATIYSNDIDWVNYIVNFSSSSFSLIELQYYKFQFGYISNWNNRATENIAYSSVALGRYIGQSPTITIQGLTLGNNTEKGYYTGEIENLESGEKIYSYSFKLYDNNNNLLEDSGEILNIDNSYRYKLQYELENNKTVYIQFSITTINGYQGDSERYGINKMGENAPNAELKVQNIDNKYVQINFKNTDTSNDHKYLIERTINQLSFEQLAVVSLGSNKSVVWKDYSIEQGIKYYYSVRELDINNCYNSSRMYHTNLDANDNSAISIDYEDMSLIGLDGKILPVKFDPKVSSFKNTILESKVETIGSKYPFFFRNGDVNYKEIPISGLISYLMNKDGEFMTDQELGFPIVVSTAAAGSYNPETESMPGKPVDETIGRSTNLTGYNITAERKFRLTVLDWLTDGKPKLFRSPTEGVYVIRLMSVSLSPNDTLGRMIYSFSATGYEVSDSSIETLIKNGLIKFPIDSASASSRLGYFILGTSVLGGNEIGGSI